METICNSCEHKECKYFEVEIFIDTVNAILGAEYELVACPDAERLDYLCNLEYENKSTGERLFIEVKRVCYGTGNNDREHGEVMAIEKTQRLLQETIDKVIEGLADEEKKKVLDELSVEIPRIKMGEEKITGISRGKRKKDSINLYEASFEKKFTDFIMSADIRILTEGFSYEIGTGHRKEQIVFWKQEHWEGFADGETYYVIRQREDNSLTEIFNRVDDIPQLKKLIEKNMLDTTSKKFPIKKMVEEFYLIYWNCL